MTDNVDLFEETTKKGRVRCRIKDNQKDDDDDTTTATFSYFPWFFLREFDTSSRHADGALLSKPQHDRSPWHWECSFLLIIIYILNFFYFLFRGREEKFVRRNQYLQTTSPFLQGPIVLKKK